MEIKFIEPTKASKQVTIWDIPRVVWDSLKIKWAMMTPLPGRWPNASSISHCQISDNPLRFFVLGNGFHLFEGRPVKLSGYFGFPRVRTIINPEVIEHGKTTIISKEGCFSYQDKTRKIKRWEQITLRFWTLLGPRTKKLYLYRACMVQHELDHFDNLSIHDRYFKRKQ